MALIMKKSKDFWRKKTGESYDMIAQEIRMYDKLFRNQKKLKKVTNCVYTSALSI